MTHMLATIMLVLLLSCVDTFAESNHSVDIPMLPTVVEQGNALLAGNGSLVERDGIKVLHLKGTPIEMGIQQGLLLGKEAEALRPFVDLSMQKHTGVAALAWKFRDLYMKTKLMPTFTRNIPKRYLEEMQGFVYGVSQGRDSDISPVIVGNVFQELALLMCTSVAAWGPASADGHLYHARNLDNNLPIEMTKSALVVVAEPEGRLPYITLSYPANFGVMHAMNSRGITVSMNYSFSREASIDGVPFVFLLRDMLERAETLAQALEIIERAPRTIGLNILIGDAKIPKAVVVEISANHYQVRQATGFLAATNRYASESMKNYQASGWYSSAGRDSRLEELQSENAGSFSPQVMADILRDKFAVDSVPRSGFVRGIDNSSTMASVVFDPSRFVMWVGVQDEASPAPDRTLRAFSLSAAIAGDETRQPDLDIPVLNADRGYESDWLAVYAAERAMTAGNIQEALVRLEPLEAKYPNAEYLLLLLASAHMRLGHDAAAATYYQRLANLSVIAEPRRLQEATYYLGLYADKRGKRELAKDWYQKSLDVQVPDLGGDTDKYRQLARTGMERPLGGDESLFKSLLTAQVFTSSAKKVPEPDGRVSSISILGTHRTDVSWVRSWLGIRVGDHVDARHLETMQKQLRALATFDDATVSSIRNDAGTVDLVIRIREGFGIYKDPVELTVNTLVGLTEETLSLRYDNVTGRAANIGGTVGWGPAQQRSVYLEIPTRIVGPGQLKLQVSSQVAGIQSSIGSLAGTKLQLQRQQVQVSLAKVINPQWTYNLNAQSLNDTHQITTKGYIAPDGHFTFVSVNIGRRAGTNASASQFSLAIGTLLTPQGDSLPRLTSSTDVKRPITANMQISAGVGGGYQHPTTPLTYQYRLGGSRTLRGYDAIINTTAYGHETLELRRYLRNDLHLALFADIAQVLVDQKSLKSLWSPGVVMRYNTPIGQTVGATMAWAPDQGTWRFQAGMTTTW